MNIAYLVEKIKAHRDRLTLALIIALTALFAFGLGRWSQLAAARPPITIDNAPAIPSIVNTASVNAVEEENRGVGVVDNLAKNFVASKNGTKYYSPSCAGVKRIKEENKVYFATREEAERSGLLPAANCF